MEDKKPVALWKGIVGTALSGIILLLFIPLIPFVTWSDNDFPLWVKVFVFIASFVCLFSLVVSIFNLASAIKYKDVQRFEKSLEQDNEESDDKTELLHKLLSEGKITIEEYDKLKDNK